MSVFGDYSRFYNLLYADKDYSGESAFILSVLRKYGGASLGADFARAPELLDLGCGTARHAILMAKEGIAVTGVDMSETMLHMGNETLAQGFWDEASPRPELYLGDARSVRFGKTFDAVTSLFHVMSYQNTEEDALATLETAYVHLKPGGLFFFDFWYGPGVLSDPPTNRIKQMEDQDFRITRKTRPVHRVSDNIVEVHFDATMENKHDNSVSELSETHFMRYWFMPELRYLSMRAGFSPLTEGVWMGFAEPDIGTWNAWIVVRK